jgi:hypothetical protein|tara:strand:+ start:5285 stop:6763 length:1479 start_codon:yes stop_codon:yes gene_type:complete
MYEQNKIINPVSYDIQSVILTADRWSEWDDEAGYDISRFVSDIIFYENLNLPYLTAAMSFLDNQSLSDKLNFTGTERVEVKIMTDEEQIDKRLSITKRFIITEVMSSEKVGDNNEMVSLHMIEERAYQSKVTSINRSFKKITAHRGSADSFAGNPIDIIQSLLRTLDRSTASGGYFLDNELMYNNNDDQLPVLDGELNIVIPNLPAIDAISWISRRCITPSGMPFYTFASMGDDRIRFVSLEAMLKMSPINEQHMPYTYSYQLLSEAQTVPNGVKSFIISDFMNTGSDNQLIYTASALGTSVHSFIDTYSGEISVVNFDPGRMFDHLHDQNILKARDVPVYDGKLKFGARNIAEINGETKTNISTSKTFSNTKRGIDDKKRSYNEVGDLSHHALKIEAEAARAFLTKNGLEIKVPGRNFLSKDNNLTIGNKISVEFKKNIIQPIQEGINNQGDLLDLRRSGEYIIYGAEHTFSVDDGYSVGLKLVRLALQKR